jgi:bacterioferritin
MWSSIALFFKSQCTESGAAGMEDFVTLVVILVRSRNPQGGLCIQPLVTAPPTICPDRQLTRKREKIMAKTKQASATPKHRGKSSKSQINELIDALNEDLAREYQAIIAYTVYSNVLTGAQWMKIASELQKHASEELAHAMMIADQIDYLGGKPTATPKPVKLSDKAEEMIRFDLDNETETIRNYRQRIKQAEAIGHYALAEQLRKIVAEEQDHQHDLATALGVDVPRVFEDGA